MIVRINKGKNVAGAVRYNEHKVEQGDARLIGAFNYYAPAAELSLRAKVGLLQAQAGLNARVTRSALHVPIAFHPDEHLSDQTLLTIAAEWMQGMHYGDQPYLVYRHEDTAHPHMHIVSITVDRDGKRITDSHEKYRSEAIRKKIELGYQLMKAEAQEEVLRVSNSLPESAIHYGREQTKKAIGTVVQTALDGYSFSRLDEFIQLLASYNVQVNVRRPKKAGGTDWYGISFQLTDGERPLSPSIKASAYWFAPTYETINNRFRSGQRKKRLHEPTLRQTIDQQLRNYVRISKADYSLMLRQAGIQLLDAGTRFYYVDHARRTVYSEADLGQAYSRAHLNSRFATASILLSQATATSPTPLADRQKKKAVPKAGPVPLTDRQRAALGRLVADQYERYKQQHRIFFESQLIHTFPFQTLVDAGRFGGYSEAQSREAVAEFERCKQSQLVDIRRRESDYVDKTTRAYLQLVSQSPMHPESRLQLLTALNLQLVVDAKGMNRLEHQHGREYYYELSAVEYFSLLTSTAHRRVALNRPLTPAEQTVVLSAATGQPLKGVGIDQVNVAFLRAILPPSAFVHVSRSLNQHYLDRLIARQPADPRQRLAYYYQRGMVISGSAGDQRIGFYITPPGSHLPVPAQVQQLPTGTSPQSAYRQAVSQLSSPAGRLLIRYWQALDQPAGEGQRQLLASVLADLARRYPAAAGLERGAQLRYLNDQREQQPASSQLPDTGGRQSIQNCLKADLQPEPDTSKPTDNLRQAIRSGMDTSEERPRKRSLAQASIRRRPKLR